MPFISVTRLRVRSWSYLPAFLLATTRIAWQARNADGSLAVKIFRERRNAFWTSTSWESEAAMRQFMRAKPHGPAMRKLLSWCDEAAIVHWTQSDGELPSWREAHRRMQGEGRPSKVNYPSLAQQSYTIPEPDPRAKSELRIKKSK